MKQESNSEALIVRCPNPDCRAMMVREGPNSDVWTCPVCGCARNVSYKKKSEAEMMQEVIGLLDKVGGCDGLCFKEGHDSEHCLACQARKLAAELRE